MADIQTTSKLVKALLKEIKETGITQARADELGSLFKPHLIGDAMDPALVGAFTRDELSQILVHRGYAVMQLARNKDNLASEVAVMTWLSEADFSVLGKNDVSRIHKFAEAVNDDRLFPRNLYQSKEMLAKAAFQISHQAPPIVVKHDWASALGNLHGTGDRVEIKLPYDTTWFEFVIGGKCVIVEAFYIPEEDDWTFSCFIEFEKDKWRLSMERKEDHAFSGMNQAIRKQIVAICVALSAKIASNSLVQAPAALNKRRAKSGKTLMKDYHVVDLSDRYKQKAESKSGDSERTSPRLHWRRGHWRRTQGNPPIWIDWMLVGNVDLGFINKHYLM